MRWYSISEILFLSLCGVLCGANDFEDIEAFGEAKLDFLRQYLPYKKGIPTPVTLELVPKRTYTFKTDLFGCKITPK